MAVSMKNKDGEMIIIRTVKDLIENANSKMTFCLSAATAFVFIGNAEEFKRDIDTLDRYFGGGLFQEKYVSLMDRKITGYCKRDAPGEPTHMFYIDGKDHGLFWLRCEYKEFIKSIKHSYKMRESLKRRFSEYDKRLLP